MGEKVIEGCLVAFFALFFILILTFAYAGIGMWLWGAIVVPVFGLPALGYWQMYGLIILLHILFPGGGYHSKSE